MQSIRLSCIQTAASQTNERRVYIFAKSIFAKCIFAQFSFRSATKSWRPHRLKTISTRNNYLEEQFCSLGHGGRHAPDRTRPPSCRRAVKIYTPLEHGCCIPWLLGMHTRSGVTKYKFRPLLGPLFTATTHPHLSILSGIKSPRIQFFFLPRTLPAFLTSPNHPLVDHNTLPFFDPQCLFFPASLYGIIGIDSRMQKMQKRHNFETSCRELSKSVNRKRSVHK